MRPSSRSFGSVGIVSTCLAVAAIAACSATEPTLDFGTGGTFSTGAVSNGGSQSDGTGAVVGSSTGGTGGTGAVGSGGTNSGHGGTGATGGSGAVGSGGTSAGKGGTVGAGGSAGMLGGGGRTAMAGRGSGGTVGMAGRAAGGRGGSPSTGAGGSAGAPTGGTTGTVDDACSVTTMPTGGTPHNSNNASGTAAGLNWTIWSNGSGGSITTYSTPAFSAAWNNSGDFLARIGLQWNQSKTYDAYGTITAQYSSKKTGSGGGYSYIGIYGWSVSPCIEWYIVDDSFNKMPVNPGSTTNKGTAMIDGGTYTLYTRPTTGTGGSKCTGTSSWTQFYSVRQTARQCGTISITQHFDAWKAAGMTLGKMDQAQILVEVGGGSGSIDFPLANITTTM